MLERLRKWCVRSYVRYKFCILLDTAYVFLVLVPISGLMAMYEQIRKHVKEFKEFWNKEAYYEVRKEIEQKDGGR